MKKKDLRVGNLVQCNGDVIEVDSILNEGINLYNGEASHLYKEIKGIPLTELWTLEFGFKITYSMGIKCWYLPGSNIEVIREKEKGVFRFGNIELNHVHKIQNLYYELGKELTI